MPASTLSAGQAPLKAEVIQADAGFVIDMEFLPDGRLIYVLLNGKIFIKQLDLQKPWEAPAAVQIAELEVAKGLESGLLGIAVDPQFAENHWIYLYYVVPDREGLAQFSQIMRYTLIGQVLSEPTVLVPDLPARPDQLYHFGGALDFGPDGKLYLIFGDGNQLAEARDPLTHQGSLLRYNPDGSIPEDNPFPGSAVYAYGLRNGFGLAWHPDNGLLYQTGNGHICDDELNLIEAGQDYGWGVHPFDACPYPDYTGQAPIYQWFEIIAPAGIVYYDHDLIPEWQDRLLICSFNDLSLWVLELGEHGREVISATIASVPDTAFNCRVDLEIGPDGWLYTSTDSTIFRTGRP
jgi:glucose/arabinose dehydrogenase